MMVRELIEELQKHDPNAEVITPGNWPHGIDEVVEVDDHVLTDGSKYPVIMLRTDQPPRP